MVSGNETTVSEILESQAVDDTVTIGLPDAIKAAREKAGTLFPQYEEQYDEDVFDFRSNGDYDSDLFINLLKNHVFLKI